MRAKKTSPVKLDQFALKFPPFQLRVHICRRMRGEIGGKEGGGLLLKHVCATVICGTDSLKNTIAQHFQLPLCSGLK